MMSPTAITDGGGSWRSAICFSKSAPESKSVELGISAAGKCFNKDSRAEGGAVRKLSSVDESSCLQLSIAYRPHSLSTVRFNCTQRLIDLRVLEQFILAVLAEALCRSYAPLAEDFQNSFPVFAPVQLFV